MRAGKFSDGIINYVFLGKELDHRDKKAHVLKASDELLLPYSAEDKEGIKELKRDFNRRTHDYLKVNPDNKNALIGHQLLSFTPEDEKKLGPDGIKRVLDEYIDLAELHKTQFVAVGHKDTSNYHIHIVYHKAQNDMTKQNDWKLNNKTVERGVALALKNKLSLVKDQDKVAATRGVLDIRIKDTDIINLREENRLLRSSRNMHHLAKLLEGQGRGIEYINDGRVRIDKKFYRQADLNAVFYLNRNESSQNSDKSKDKNYIKIDVKTLGKLSKSLDYAIFKGQGIEVNETSDNHSEKKRNTKPLNMVTIHPDKGARPSLRRKRRGKQYLLKKRKRIDNLKDKGHQI